LGKFGSDTKNIYDQLTEEKRRELIANTALYSFKLLAIEKKIPPPNKLRFGGLSFTKR